MVKSAGKSEPYSVPQTSVFRWKTRHRSYSSYSVCEPPKKQNFPHKNLPQNQKHSKDICPEKPNIHNVKPCAGACLAGFPTAGQLRTGSVPAPHCDDEHFPNQYKPPETKQQQ